MSGNSSGSSSARTRIRNYARNFPKYDDGKIFTFKMVERAFALDRAGTSEKQFFCRFFLAHPIFCFRLKQRLPLAAVTARSP